MKIGNIFTTIAKSRVGGAFFKKLSNPDKSASITNALLSADTIVSTANYMYFTQQQKDIPTPQRNALQVQHVLSCIASLAICTPINKRVGKFAGAVSKKIDPKIVDPHKVQAGIGILVPTMTVLTFNRCLLPAILTPISSVFRDFFQKREDKKLHKLDVKA